MDVRFELTTSNSSPSDDASVNCNWGMDLETGYYYCYYAGVPLALF